ncbi:MAG: YhcH/YjgK/YiaL family protein [Oscillospiraceae bacterium]|nr:YhcH/YjgK/YiaL family protein [Oscillospiraceae bacterium]
MILDILENANQYAGIHPGIDRALAEMKRFTPDNYGDGRVEVDGDNVFLLLNNYETHPKSESMAEAHRKYIDVMYMVEGVETVYVKNVEKLRCVTEEYTEENEALIAETDDDATAVRLEAGYFVILFPQDAHSPACDADGKHTVKKIIGKVRV